MGTFLTTRRMSPELAARVLASVRGKRGAKPSSGTQRARKIIIGVARLGAAAAVATVIFLVVLRERQKQDEFERAREAVLEAATAAMAPLSSSDLSAEARIESWLQRGSVAYEGDFVADALRAPGGLDGALAQGSVYVRGTTDQLRTASGIAQAAAVSVKDPFVTCLFAPPATRSERALLEKVHGAYAGDTPARAAGLRRLRDVQLGLPFLAPSWAAKVASAASWDELHVLRRAFEEAPIAAATLGLKAGLLIFAVDEPGDPKGPAELDGERPHPVRVGLVDLASSTVLLRLRKPVDPSGFSADKRPLYASGIDSCALAYDVRAGLARSL